MPVSAAHDEFLRPLEAGALRLRLNDAIRAGCWAGLVALGAAVLLVLAQRLFFLGPPARLFGLAFLKLPPWMLWTILALLLAPLAAVAAALARSGKGTLAAALAADERLALQARLASAVAMTAAAERSPMIPELLLDARRHAAALNPARDFPLRLPRQAVFLPPALALVGAALLLMPQADLLGRRAVADVKAAQKEELAEIARMVQPKVEALKRKPQEPTANDLRPSEQLADELSKLVKEMKEGADRDTAVTKLNKLLDEAKLAEQRVADMQKLVEQMKQLEKAPDRSNLPTGPLQSTGLAMASSDFKKTADELNKLAQQLKEGKLSGEAKAALERDLERLAKMGGDWKELAKELSEAAEKLGEGDAEQAYEALQAASEDLKELAELLKELAGEGGGGLGGEGQRLQADAEMIKQLKEMLKNAPRCSICKKMYCLNCNRPRCACEGQDQCQCQPGQGQGQGQGVGVGAGAGAGVGAGQAGAGAGQGGAQPGAGGVGGGMGGPGQGQGGKAPEREHDVQFQSAKAPSQINKEGRIVGHMFVRGEPTLRSDDKKVEYEEAHTAAAKAATEAVESGRIPRDLREYVREYFDSTKPAAPAKAPEKQP